MAGLAKLGSGRHQHRLLLHLHGSDPVIGSDRVAAAQSAVPRAGHGAGHLSVPLRRPHRQRRLCLALDPRPRPSGVLNDILMRLSIIDLPQAYLAQRGLALADRHLFEAWRYFPFAMLMILARLQAIDRTLYEAADVDGANTWQKFWYVTMPELRYVLGAIFLLRLIWTFNKFDDIFLLTGGGFGTNVLPVLTYQFSFKPFNFGKGAANSDDLAGHPGRFPGHLRGTVMRMWKRNREDKHDATTATHADKRTHLIWIIWTLDQLAALYFRDDLTFS